MIEGAWKHDLFSTVNRAAAANGTKASQRKEERIQFPPRTYTEEEKAKVPDLSKSMLIRPATRRKSAVSANGS
jgi:hypothetical protein